MFDAMFVIVPILMVVIIVFTIIMTFSPKMRGKFMSKQMKSMRYMMEESKDDLAKLSGTAISIKKQMLDENETALSDIAEKEAKIKSVGIKSAAKAIKEGLTEDDTIFCKHCGKSIDSDSKFCKICGKEL
jgi:rRNA maturation endonuclease Nob1